MKSSQPRHGFTLIEMLVVIAIIALLSTLIVPAVGRALSKAKSVRCLAHMKQIGTAIASFSSDNQGRIPLVTNQGSSSSAGKLHWIQYLSGYVGKEDAGWVDPNDPTSVFWGCPEWRGRDASWNIPPRANAAVSSSPGYGMNMYPEQPANWNANSRNDQSNEPLYALDQITHASNRVLVADAIDWHVSASWNYDNGYFGFTSWSRGAPQRHGKTANYLFFDMHAQALPYTKAHMYLYDPSRAGL